MGDTGNFSIQEVEAVRIASLVTKTWAPSLIWPMGF